MEAIMQSTPVTEDVCFLSVARSIVDDILTRYGLHMGSTTERAAEVLAVDSAG